MKETPPTNPCFGRRKACRPLSRTECIMRRLPFSSLFLLTFLAGSSWAQVAQVPQVDLSFEPYAKPHILADVGHGRKIHLICMGEGSPTVIMTGGAGNWSSTWRKVQGEVSRKTRACAWDRAGFGFSDPSPLKQDAVHTEADLEQALVSANIAGPYVLVGHSLGSAETLLFADRHLHETVGMVLVDPSFPDQSSVIKRLYPHLDKVMHESDSQDEGVIEKCIAGLKNGSLKPADPALAECTNDQADYPADLKKSLLHFNSDPDRLVTQKSYEDAESTNSKEMTNVQRNYGRIPLVVLTAADAPSPLPAAFTAPAVKSEMTDLETKTWRQAHKDLAALSTEGREELVPATTHFIQLIKPQVVVSAIDQVVAKTRIAEGRKQN
jgi:pimeloyl-ACP methyl ester carboxylesterase